jgi:hypothetical protein
MQQQALIEYEGPGLVLTKKIENLSIPILTGMFYYKSKQGILIRLGEKVNP